MLKFIGSRQKNRSPAWKQGKVKRVLPKVRGGRVSETKLRPERIAYEDIRLLPKSDIKRKLMTASVDGIYDGEGEI